MPVIVTTPYPVGRGTFVDLEEEPVIWIEGVLDLVTLRSRGEKLSLNRNILGGLELKQRVIALLLIVLVGLKAVSLISRLPYAQKVPWVPPTPSK